MNKLQKNKLVTTELAVDYDAVPKKDKWRIGDPQPKTANTKKGDSSHVLHVAYWKPCYEGRNFIRYYSMDWRHELKGRCPEKDTQYGLQRLHGKVYNKKVEEWKARGQVKEIFIQNLDTREIVQRYNLATDQWQFCGHFRIWLCYQDHVLAERKRDKLPASETHYADKYYSTEEEEVQHFIDLYNSIEDVKLFWLYTNDGENEKAGVISQGQFIALL